MAKISLWHILTEEYPYACVKPYTIMSPIYQHLGVETSECHDQRHAQA